jgi:hypothetical protein
MIVGTAGHVDFTAFARDRALSASEGEAMIQRFSLVRLPTLKTEYVITSVVVRAGIWRAIARARARRETRARWHMGSFAVS